jgi:methyl coenzyme M reductase gamma subunit
MNVIGTLTVRRLIRERESDFKRCRETQIIYTNFFSATKQLRADMHGHPGKVFDRLVELSQAVAVHLNRRFTCRRQQAD